MKKKNVSKKGFPLRRSARLSSPTYKSAAPEPLQPEPSATTNRRRFKKKKPNPNPKPEPERRVINKSYDRHKWTEAERARLVFENLRKGLSRKIWYSRPGPGYDELTCIFPSGDDTFTWTDDSRGTTWIALRGFASYLVLAMDSDYEPISFLINIPPGNHSPAKCALLATLDQMGDPSSKFNQAIALHDQRKQRFPFAVVSISPETFKDPQERKKASSRAIEFLKAKLFDCSDDLTLPELLMTGIGALDEMFGPKFKSNKIWQVCYNSMRWNIGCSILSSCNVDEWSKEINAEPTRNVAEKLQIEDRGSLRAPVSLTGITSMKLRDRIILVADGLAIDWITGQILDRAEIKIKCVLNQGVYFAGAGNIKDLNAVYNFLLRSYEATDTVDIGTIASLIQDAVNKNEITVNELDMLLGGVSVQVDQDDLVELVSIKKEVNSECRATPVSRMFNLGYSKDEMNHMIQYNGLPERVRTLMEGDSEISIEEENAAIKVLLKSVARAALRKWAAGGKITFVSIRNNGTVRRLTFDLLREGDCSSGYINSYDETNFCKFDSDYDGLPVQIPTSRAL